MIIENIKNADELVKLMEKYPLPNLPLWRIKVDHNPGGEGKPTWLWAKVLSHGDINTFYFYQDDIDGVDYMFSGHWHSMYTGTFQLDTNPLGNPKPEIYKVGDTVEVLETGKRFWIEEVYDNVSGVSYVLDSCTFPAYAVRKVVDFSELEPKKETVTLELTPEQLERVQKLLGEDR